MSKNDNRLSPLSLRRTDRGQIGPSLDHLADELADGFAVCQHVRLPADWKTLRHVVIAGMGGSHLAADIVCSVFGQQLKKPVTILSEAQLPSWVDRTMLVAVCSYSGTTEETLAVLKQAQARKIPTVAITTGGALAKADLPKFVFDPTANNSNQPRLGVAYSLTAVVKILIQVGALSSTAVDQSALIAAATKATKKYSAAVEIEKNPAKQVATALLHHQPILIGTVVTAGNLHTFQNQLHENAKTFASFAVLPELNHHLMEGLRNTAEAKKMIALTIADPEATPRFAARWKFTMAILRRLHIKQQSIRLSGATPFERAIELLAFGGYTSWYLAVLRKQQPAAIPTVDELKEKMKRV